MFDFLKGGGKIQVKTDKMSYSHGETVRGKIILSMKKTKHARGIKIELFAYRSVPHRNSRGGKSTRRETIYTFEHYLDGERDYSGTKEYNFELRIPNQNEVKIPDTSLGKIAKVAIGAAQMTGMVASPPKWYIRASLDITKGIDVKKKIQINVV